NMLKWVNIFKGFLMGICELIPGVSSGTMALLLGIYDQFLGAVSRVVSKHWKNAVLYLIPLVIGMGIAILTMSSLIDYLLRNHTVAVQWFFIGLILGVVPMMLRISNYRVEFRMPHYVLILLMVAGLFIMGMLRAAEVPIEAISITASLFIKLFFSAIVLHRVDSGCRAHDAQDFQLLSGVQNAALCTDPPYGCGPLHHGDAACGRSADRRDIDYSAAPHQTVLQWNDGLGNDAAAGD